VANDVLALCEHLAARPSNSNPDHIDDFIAPSGDDDLKRLIAIAEDQHFVRTEPKWADGGHSHDPVLITASGLRHVETVHEHRDRRKERNWAGRQGLLLWAYDHAYDNPDLPINSPGRFLEADPPYNFWGHEFTENNVREATDYLIEAGLLELYGARLASGEPQNIQITRAGKDCVEQYAGSPIAYLNRSAAPPTPGNTQNFYGRFTGQNAQGQKISQTQNTGISAESLTTIFDGLRALLSQVDDPDDREDLTIAVADLERAARQDGPNLAEVVQRAGMVQRLATRVVGAELGATVGAATSGVLDVLGNIG